MNILNRILVLLGLLFWLALALILAISPLEALRTAQGALENTAGWLANLQTTNPWLFAAGQVLLALLALLIFILVLWAEVRPHRPQAIRVRTESGSQATVTADSVARRLAWHIDQLADVVAVGPQVQAHGRSVDVTLDLQTRPEIDVPMKTDEVVKVAREVITERMGLQLGKIQVRIHHAPYTEGA